MYAYLNSGSACVCSIARRAASAPPRLARAYYERCLRILSEVEDAERAAGDLQAAPRGLLRVTTSVSFGAHQLAPAIADYLVAYPDVSVDLILKHNFVDLVEERIDLAIRLGRLSDLSLITKKLYAVETALCASPGYLAANGTPLQPGDLVEHNCLIYTYAAGRAWTFTDLNGKAEVIRISGHLLANSGDALLALPSGTRALCSLRTISSPMNSPPGG